jgi:hypothetical protein
MVSTVRDDLHTELLEAEVVWSAAICAEFKPLFELQRELFADIQSYLALSNPAESEQSRAAWDKIRHERRSVMYDMMDALPDEFADEMAAAISRIESYLKPHLAK